MFCSIENTFWLKKKYNKNYDLIQCKYNGLPFNINAFHIKLDKTG